MALTSTFWFWAWESRSCRPILVAYFWYCLHIPSTRYYWRSNFVFVGTKGRRCISVEQYHGRWASRHEMEWMNRRQWWCWHWPWLIHPMWHDTQIAWIISRTAGEEEELQLTLYLLCMNEGMPSLHSVIQWSARQRWRMPPRWEDERWSTLCHCELIWWQNNENQQSATIMVCVGWVLVQSWRNAMNRRKSVVSNIFLLALPVLFGHKEFSWKDKNKFKFSF